MSDELKTLGTQFIETLCSESPFYFAQNSYNDVKHAGELCQVKNFDFIF